MQTLFTNIRTEEIGADLSKVVDRISKQYDRPDIAFQKEAIQNSWDVRNDRKNGDEWSLRIYEYKDLDYRTHVVVEDFGTKGMNLDRWESFSSLWKPKKYYDDAGGKGQGKFVLMNASKEHILFVESNSEDGYLCKFLQDGKKSNSEEKLNISALIPGAKTLNRIGTKIWIYDIREEFLKTLHSEEFINSIVESWWQVLGPRFNRKIYMFDKEIIYKPLPASNEEITLLENYKIENFGRIKRLHLGFYPEKVSQAFDGVLVQRANMTIIKAPFEVYDKEYQGHFSGYIEFDLELETKLKEIERNDHSSFQYESPWKEIKSFIKNESDKFVSKIIPSKQQRKAINIKNLSEIIKKANQIINEYCPEILGGGTVVPPIQPKEKPPIRIKHLFINKREVKWDDTISMRCGLFNSTKESKKIFLNVRVKREENKILEEVYSLKIEPGEAKSLKLSEIILDKDKFQKGKYIVRATLSDEKHDLDTKSTSFYLEEKREPVKKGFIKNIVIWDLNNPTIRNKPVQNGVLVANLMHKDCDNIWTTFEDKPVILNRQMGFYLIKLCLDDAARLLLLNRLTDGESRNDIEEIVQDIKEIQDRMYYDVYV